MSDEYRSDPGDGESGVSTILVVILLLLAVAGGGFFLLAGRQSAARQVEIQAVEAERAAQEAAEAQRRAKGP
jgi:hypothetical protein